VWARHGHADAYASHDRDNDRDNGRDCVAIVATVLARRFSEADARQAVDAAVRDVLSALKHRDGAAIASAAHPAKGVRFSQDA
jgi:hypothetical protein